LPAKQRAGTGDVHLIGSVKVVGSEMFRENAVVAVVPKAKKPKGGRNMIIRVWHIEWPGLLLSGTFRGQKGIRRNRKNSV